MPNQNLALHGRPAVAIIGGAVFLIILVTAGYWTWLQLQRIPCRLTDLTIDAQWIDEGGLTGRIAFANPGPKECYIEGHPTVSLRDTDGRDLSVSIIEEGTGSRLRVAPNQKFQVVLTWENWCTAPPRGVVSVISLPGSNAQSSIPVSIGAAAKQVPACVSDLEPSRLRVAPFASL